MKPKQKILHLPDHHVLAERMHKEYDALIQQMTEYYELKKQLMNDKKQKLMEQYEHAVLKVRYQQMRQHFKQQQLQWQMLMKQYA